MENPTNTNSPNKPNIILITVDQLRFPMHFESLGIATADDFIKQHMPNLYSFLWEPGVKFSNYYTAASDCTAARATIHTGLYAYQTYSMLTLITYPPNQPQQPILDSRFPTIGKLMKDAGYVTPYFGKWHLSYDVSDLTDYGYDSYSPTQDYVGYAGQGYATDDTPAWEAAHWINDYVAQSESDPFFLTLNFVNPHDKQWFWGAMQADDFYEVHKEIKKKYPQEANAPGPYVEIPVQAEPPSRYPTDIDLAIPNFQEQHELNTKPPTQSLVKEVFQYQMGGIYEPDEKSGYTRVPLPQDFHYALAMAHQPDHKAIAPATYWSKALDSYLQVMTMVDRSIGNFMRSLSEDVRQNSIFIFTSDHGEYGSSHGLQGKGGTVYEEGIRVPLVVRDSGNRFTTQVDQTRNQLTSSVDLLRMIVTMGNGGPGWWMDDADNKQLYGNRCDLLSILHNAGAPGRTNALTTTDEFIPDKYNYNNSNLHVIGLITTDPNGNNKQKLGVYTTWRKDSPEYATVIRPSPANSTNTEFYDASQEPNEKVSTPTSSGAQTALNNLFGGSQWGLLFSEVQAPLPEQYRAAQTKAYQELLHYMDLVNHLANQQTAQDTSEEVKRRAAHVWAF